MLVDVKDLRMQLVFPQMPKHNYKNGGRESKQAAFGSLRHMEWEHSATQRHTDMKEASFQVMHNILSL